MAKRKSLTIKDSPALKMSAVSTLTKNRAEQSGSQYDGTCGRISAVVSAGIKRKLAARFRLETLFVDV